MRTEIVLLSALFSMNALATQMATLPSAEEIVSSKQPGSEQSREWKPEVHVISNSHVNRIVTPFKAPSLKMDAVQGVAHQQAGNVLYLSTDKSKRGDIAAFITEKGDESMAIPVIFKPTPVGPQEVVIGQLTSQSSPMAQRFERSFPRDETIRQVLETLAHGQMPSGYELRGLDATYLPTCNQEGLTFDFYRGQLAAGGDYMVTIGTVQNTSEQVVEFKENYCFGHGVVAVSSYPEVQLVPNQKTEVFVMFYRNKPVVAPQVQRRSLIGG